MKVYRLENDKGKGPYTDCSSLCHTYGMYSHPGPYDDGLEDAMFEFQAKHGARWREFYKFGFESLEAFSWWFDHEYFLARAEEKGFRLRIYKVNKQSVRFGDHQLIYRSDRATLWEE